MATEAVALFLERPVLFGGNAGKGNFDLLNFGDDFNEGKWNATAQGALCLLYQIATADVPSSLSGVLELPVSIVDWAVGKVNPVSACEQVGGLIDGNNSWSRYLRTRGVL